MKLKRLLNTLTKKDMIMKKNDIEIIYQGIEKLINNENNPKIHTDEQIEKIKKSIKEFGFNDPIAVDENNLIIEGHGRLAAAIELGMDEVPTFILKDLSEEEKKAYSIIHNKQTLSTGFDYDLLNEELKSIKSIDMSEYDFDLVFDGWFDDNGGQLKSGDKIIVTIEEDKADDLRDFLKSNKIKFTEAKC